MSEFDCYATSPDRIVLERGDTKIYMTRKEAIDLAVLLVETAGWLPIETAPRCKCILAETKYYTTEVMFWHVDHWHSAGVNFKDEDIIQWLPVPKSQGEKDKQSSIS